MNHLGGRLRRKPAPHLPHQLADLPLRSSRRLTSAALGGLPLGGTDGKDGLGISEPVVGLVRREAAEEIELEMSRGMDSGDVVDYLTFSSVAHSYPLPCGEGYYLASQNQVRIWFKSCH